MIAYRCDLCNRVKKCVLKEIDGLNYDICLECWARLEAKLNGKEKQGQEIALTSICLR